MLHRFTIKIKQKETCYLLREIDILNKTKQINLQGIVINDLFSCIFWQGGFSFLIKAVMFKICSWHFLNTPFMTDYCTSSIQRERTLCLSVLSLSLSHRLLSVYRTHTHTHAAWEWEKSCRWCTVSRWPRRSETKQKTGKRGKRTPLPEVPLSLQCTSLPVTYLPPPPPFDRWHVHALTNCPTMVLVTDHKAISVQVMQL